MREERVIQPGIMRRAVRAIGRLAMAMSASTSSFSSIESAHAWLPVRLDAEMAEREVRA